MATPSITTDYCAIPLLMVGDVSLGVDVTLAPGVLIQVAPGSRLVLEAGVCVASGTVIRVYGGTLRLETGCSVATGVILLGAGTVGAQACIGAGSTVVNPALPPQAVVAAGSWQYPHISTTPISDDSLPRAEATPTATTTAQIAAEVVAGDSPQVTPEIPPAERPTQVESSSEGILATHTVIYGREQVLQLIKTLFPHRQPLSPPSS